MLLTVRQLYQLYYGGDQITRDFLFPLAANEPDESIELRFRKAAYMNIVAKTIDTYLGYCFSSPPKLSDIVYFNLAESLRASTFHSALGGSALLVGLEKDPVLKVFPSTAYEINDEEQAIRVQVCQDGEEGTWMIYKDRIVANIEGKPTQELKRNEDSVVEVMWNEKKASLVRDVAPYAVKIFNYDSIADKQADNSAFWVSSGTPLPAEKKMIQPYMHFARSNNEVPEPKFHHPESQQMENVDKRIEQFILRAGKTVGLEREFASEFVVASGAAQQMQMVSTNAITLMIASANVRAINRVSEGAGKLSGVTGGTIALEPALTPQAKTELLNQLTIGASKINTPEAAEAYAAEIIKVTLSGAPEKALQSALKSIEGKGLEALKTDTLNFA